jgi:diphthamide synthase (EF-2-diphthine--ammonia ligase)
MPKSATLDITPLLPRKLGYYHYLGSLTTPPLTQNVEWYVLKQPVSLSAEQLATLRKHYPRNNRSIQPLNGRPVIDAVIPPQCDNATYEAAFATALDTARARWPDCRGIAFGDLFLDDVRAWREALCERLGWTPRFPLFGRDTAALAREMIAGGLQAALCCVDTQQLDARFSGRAFDAALLADLPSTCDPCGERGEFHTLMHAGPMFATPLRIAHGEQVMRDGRFAYTDFVNAAA